MDMNRRHWLALGGLTLAGAALAPRRAAAAIPRRAARSGSAGTRRRTSTRI